MSLTLAAELNNLGALVDIHRGEVMEALRRGAFIGAQFAQGLWIRGAHAALGHTAGEYIRGLSSSGQIRVVSESKGEKGYEIIVEVVNTCPHASVVEEGHAAFHLPSLVHWGSGHTKAAKGGGYYMHVPFKHTAYAAAETRKRAGYTIGAINQMMPEHIYAQAKRLAFTARMHQGPIHNAKGQFVAADRYRKTYATTAHGFAFGASAGETTLKHRLIRPSGSGNVFIMGTSGVGAGGPGETGYVEQRGERQVGRDRHGRPLVNPAWKTSKFAGMMRTGSPAHAEYLTIRTMTDRSTGWNIPAQAGHFIAAKVATILQTDSRYADAVIQAIVTASTPGGEP
jgi:hypothetical protein